MYGLSSNTINGRAMKKQYDEAVDAYNNLVFDVINTLQDCKASVSLLIDPQFDTQLFNILMNIDKNRENNWGVCKEAVAEFNKNFRAIVDGFEKRFPAIFPSDGVRREELKLMYGGQFIARALVSVGYEPFDFNWKVREDIEEACNLVRLSKIPADYVNWKGLRTHWMYKTKITFIEEEPAAPTKNRPIVDRLYAAWDELIRKV